jgi:hypothetical protein
VQLFETHVSEARLGPPDFVGGIWISGWCIGLIAGYQICLALLDEGNLNA